MKFLDFFINFFYHITLSKRRRNLSQKCWFTFQKKQLILSSKCVVVTNLSVDMKTFGKTKRCEMIERMLPGSIIIAHPCSSSNDMILLSVFVPSKSSSKHIQYINLAGAARPSPSEGICRGPSSLRLAWQI